MVVRFWKRQEIFCETVNIFCEIIESTLLNHLSQLGTVCKTILDNYNNTATTNKSMDFNKSENRVISEVVITTLLQKIS